MAVMVKCPQCGKEMKSQGLTGHIRMKHENYEERIAQLEARLADAGIPIPARPAAAESPPADVPAAPAAASPSEEDRLAVLADWLEGMTKDAWVKIGEEAGYFDDVPEEPAAVLADASPAPAPAEKPAEKPTKFVYLPKSGLIVEVEA
jgi:hypothetical protein